MEVSVLIQPICSHTCGRFRVAFHDSQDITQEVTLRILRRLAHKGLDATAQHYIRKSARLESKKLCIQLMRRQTNDAFVLREVRKRCEAALRRFGVNRSDS